MQNGDANRRGVFGKRSSPTSWPIGSWLFSGRPATAATLHPCAMLLVPPQASRYFVSLPRKIARCGVDELTISRFAARFGDSIFDSTDTALTLRVTKKLVQKWASSGLTLDCMANLLLDKTGRLSFEAEGTELAMNRIAQGTRVLKAQERARQFLHQRELVERDEARRAWEEMPMYRVAKTVEKATENAGRPYAEALKLSDEVLDRVHILLRNEQDAAMIAALWKAAATVQPTTRASSAERQ